MEVTFRNFSIHREFKISLSQIDPQPERIRFRGGGAILATCIFGTLLLITLVCSFFISDTGTRLAVLFFPGFLLAIPFIAALTKMIRRSLDCLSFPVHGDGALQVWFEKPDPETFNAFCAELSKRIKEASTREFSEQPHKTLALEIQELAKLRESGVISESEFEKAKTKLIDAAGERKIGFRP